MTTLLERGPELTGPECLRRTVREVCDAVGGTAAARTVEAVGGSHDLGLWELLCRRTGLSSLGLPLEHGGSGTLTEVAVACEELGRALLPVPFLASTVLAGQVLARCGPRSDDALALVAAGARATLAVAGPDGAWDPARLEVRASAQGLLSGRADFVLDGTTAELVIVAARTADGADLYLLSTDAPGVRAVAVEAFDVSRTQAVLTFDAAPAVRLTTCGTADPVLRAALRVAAVALAAEQLGGAQACLELTVGHLRRRGPDRPTGSAQAALRRCAELQVLVDSCREAVTRAAAARPGDDDPAAAADVVQDWCSAAYRTVTAECARLGAAGSDGHLYFRRARADAALLGAAPRGGGRRSSRLSA
ncbi:MAG TPA: acyl-CoA dehydrogenase family protein [Mycobacteriales bacterium]|nr:acyl-CoA dehydrogenase family protein [Mycobacteriales bacterium]